MAKMICTLFPGYPERRVHFYAVSKGGIAHALKILVFERVWTGSGYGHTLSSSIGGYRLLRPHPPLKRSPFPRGEGNIYGSCLSVTVPFIHSSHRPSWLYTASNMSMGAAAPHSQPCWHTPSGCSGTASAYKKNCW